MLGPAAVVGHLRPGLVSSSPPTSHCWQLQTIYRWSLLKCFGVYFLLMVEGGALPDLWASLSVPKIQMMSPWPTDLLLVIYMYWSRLIRKCH